jgi:hypothetical protein
MKRLAHMARKEEAPRIDVRADVLRRIAARQRPDRSLFYFTAGAAAAAAAAAVYIISVLMPLGDPWAALASAQDPVSSLLSLAASFTSSITGALL